MPTKSNAPQTYWLPLEAVDTTTCASLAGTSGAINAGATVQDPVDSVNLLGTIVGGQIEATVDDDVAAYYGGPIEIAILILPPNLTLPANPVASGSGTWQKFLKEYDQFMWLRGNMTPVPPSLSSSYRRTWYWQFQLTTARQIPARGSTIAWAFYNANGTALGASARATILLDLYLVLQGSS